MTQQQPDWQSVVVYVTATASASQAKLEGQQHHGTSQFSGWKESLTLQQKFYRDRYISSLIMGWTRGAEVVLEDQDNAVRMIWVKKQVRDKQNRHQCEDGIQCHRKLHPTCKNSCALHIKSNPICANVIINVFVKDLNYWHPRCSSSIFISLVCRSLPAMICLLAFAA